MGDGMLPAPSRVDTIMDDEPRSEDSGSSSDDSEFFDKDIDNDAEWTIDPTLTRERTAEEKNAIPTTGRTLGLERYANAIASIERRALEQERRIALRKAAASEARVAARKAKLASNANAAATACSAPPASAPRSRPSASSSAHVLQ